MKPQFRENLETVIEQGMGILSFVSGMTFESYMSDDKRN